MATYLSNHAVGICGFVDFKDIFLAYVWYVCFGFKSREEQVNYFPPKFNLVIYCCILKLAEY